MKVLHFNGVIVCYPAHHRRENKRLVTGRVGVLLHTVSSSLRHFGRVRHRRQGLAGASLDPELALHEIEERAEAPRLLAPAEEGCADLQGRAFPIGEHAHQPLRPYIVLAHDVRQNAESYASDHELARDADVIHGNSSDHVDHLVGKPAAKIPDAFGALMFGHDAIEMFEIVDAKGHALSFQERRACINASRNACEAADAALRFGKSAQLNCDVVWFDRDIDPAAVGVDHKMDVGITDGERGDRAAEPTDAKIHGHADAEHSPQFALHACRADARFFYFRGDAFAMLVKSLTDVGDRKLAASFLEQVGAELIFQKHQLTADGGFGNIELLRSAADAAGVDDFEKQQQRV